MSAQEFLEHYVRFASHIGMRYVRLALVLLLAFYLASEVNGVDPKDVAEKASTLGLTHRVPWTTSRVKGIPDPPAPFKLERSFNHINVPNLIALSALPHSKILLAVDHEKEWGGPSRVLQFIDNQDSNTTHLFLDIPEIIYGLAFHPDFVDNGFVYVGCNGRSETLGAKATKVLRFKVGHSGNGFYECDVNSRQVVIEWPSNGHNGGDLVFGNDGKLFVTAGDGTSDSDVNRTGQDLTQLPGSLLRIDVDRTEGGQNYSVPIDNPFVDVPNARTEIWAYGLRNPWRITFDRESEQLWIGNNGQDLWESVYLIEKGANYGWSIKESNHPFHEEQDSGPVPISLATAEHHHSEARSLTGGHVYRGKAYPSLVGAYVYGDFSTGNIWAIQNDARQEPAKPRLIARSRAQISGFGIDGRGELLVADHAGGIYHLTPNSNSENSDFPRLLSQTGLFANVASEVPADGVIPYSVISPLWSDGAIKRRWLAVPNDETIGYKSRGSWDFPEGSVLVKSFGFPQQPDGKRRLIETRLMTKTDGEWYGYSYRWNESQTEAKLVEADGLEEELTWVAGDKPGAVRWRYPSRTECMVCHSRAANFVLGLSTEQMHRTQVYGSSGEKEVEAAQIPTLAHIGMFGEQTALGLDSAETLVDPQDIHSNLADRARSYLHANCSSCHMNAGGGNARINLLKFPKLSNTRLTDTAPLHGRLGNSEAELLVAGQAANSLLYLRMSRRGQGQMPPLASNRIDPMGVELIRRWIESLDGESSE